MVTFGADPGTEDKPWDDPAPRSGKAPRPAVFDLVYYFTYHPQLRMSQRIDENDKLIVASLFRRRLAQGFSVPALKQMIDRFYHSWAADTDTPALTFASNKVQGQLTEEVEISQKDPVLSWLLSGMPNDGPFSDVVAVRRSVLLHAGDALLRYPDVVADILRTEASIDDRLTTLNAIICARLGQDYEVEPDLVAVCRKQIESMLPPELVKTGVGPSTLRPQRDTIQQAVISIPLQRRTR